MSSLLEVRDVSVAFDGFKAINHLNFAIAAREIRAIIGPNGAGKTTFMDIVTGKTKPDQGEVLWGAKSINLLKFSESQIASMGIGRKFQRPTVFEALSVESNLNAALKHDKAVLPTLFYRRNKADASRIRAIAETTGLLGKLSRPAGELSHGQKQWLEIGMLLAQDPELLLVDEPAAGMTASERETTAKLLRTMAASRAIVVVEHDMDFVRQLDCKVTVLHEGAVLAEGSIDHVIADQQVVDVYLGR